MAGGRPVDGVDDVGRAVPGAGGTVAGGGVVDAADEVGWAVPGADVAAGRGVDVTGGRTAVEVPTGGSGVGLLDPVDTQASASMSDAAVTGINKSRRE